MRISIKFGLVPGKSSDLPIRMRISYDGIRLDIRCGFVCPPSAWDDSSMRMVPGTSNRYGEKASFINTQLSKQEADINSILVRYELDGKVPDKSLLKNDFDVVQGRARSSSDCLSSLFAAYISENKRTLAANSITAYSSAMKRVSQYDFANKPTDSITQEDLSLFINDLWDEDLENETVSHYISRIKFVLRWARRNSRYHGTIPEDFRPKLKNKRSKDIMYLEWPEFEKIYNLDLSLERPKTKQARDMFCLCCATGLRISDCIALSWDNVFLDGDCPKIHVIAKKTKKTTVIELNKYSRSILVRYYENKTGPLVFEKLNLQFRRYHLYRIAELAGIDRKVRRLTFVGSSVSEEYVPVYQAITTHWGRHTFIVHALRLGIPPVVIMSWTGHSNYDSMKPYIAITSDAKVENMAKFD